jgi:hypothetical protein
MLMLLFVDVEHGELSMMCDAVIATSASWKCVGKFKTVAWRQFQFLYLHFYQSSQQLKFFIIISNSLQNKRPINLLAPLLTNYVLIAFNQTSTQNKTVMIKKKTLYCSHESDTQPLRLRLTKNFILIACTLSSSELSHGLVFCYEILRWCANGIEDKVEVYDY